MDDFSFLDNDFVTAEEASKPNLEYGDPAASDNVVLDQNQRLKNSVLEEREELDGRLRTMGYSIYDRGSTRANDVYGGGGGYGGGRYGGGGGYGGGVPGFGGGGGGFGGGFGGQTGGANVNNRGDHYEDFVEVENDDGKFELGVDDGDEENKDDEEVDGNQFIDTVKGRYEKPKASYGEDDRVGYSTWKDPDEEPINPHEWERTPQEHGGPEPPIFSRWPTQYEREVLEEEIERDANPQQYESDSDAGEFPEHRKQFDIPYREGFSDPFAKEEKPLDRSVNISAVSRENENAEDFQEDQQENEDEDDNKWYGYDKDLTESQAEEIMKKHRDEDDNTQAPEFDNLDLEKTLREQFVEENQRSLRRKSQSREPRDYEESEMRKARPPGTYYHMPTNAEYDPPPSYQQPRGEKMTRPPGTHHYTNGVSPKSSSYQQSRVSKSMRSPGTYYHVPTTAESIPPEDSYHQQPRVSKSMRPSGTYYHVPTTAESIPPEDSYHQQPRASKSTRPPGTYYHVPTTSESISPEDSPHQQPRVAKSTRPTGTYYHVPTTAEPISSEGSSYQQQREAKSMRPPGTYYHIPTTAESISPGDSSYQETRQVKTTRPPGTYYHIPTEDEGEDQMEPSSFQQNQRKVKPPGGYQTAEARLDPTQGPNNQPPGTAPQEGVKGAHPQAEATGNSSEVQRPDRPKKAEWAEKELKEMEEKIAADRSLAKEREAQLAAQGGGQGGAPPPGYGPPRPRIQSAMEIRAQMALQRLAMRAFGAARKKGKKGRPTVMFI